MTNVTVCKKHRVEFCGARPCDICIMDAKCLEVERLRKALEKIRDIEREPFGFFIAQNIAINALTPPPAAGAPEEADETGAARKDK